MSEVAVRKMRAVEAEATPWTRRRAAISTRIELAALQLCVDRAIEDVTVDEIAAAVGISRRTFYHYFENIEDIFAEMPRRALDEMAAALEARPKSEPIAQAFLNAMLNRRRSDEEHDIRRLAMLVSQRSPAAYWRAVHRTGHDDDPFMRVLAERLRMAGQDPASASLIAHVFGCITGHVSQQIGGREYRDDPESLVAAFHTIAALMNGLDAPDDIAVEPRARVSGVR